MKRIECCVLIYHIGKGEPINGDPIYNGAMDNASGMATLLEAARTSSKKKQRFRRSVVFLAVTAHVSASLSRDVE